MSVIGSKRAVVVDRDPAARGPLAGAGARLEKKRRRSPPAGRCWAQSGSIRAKGGVTGSPSTGADITDAPGVTLAGEPVTFVAGVSDKIAARVIRTN